MRALLLPLALAACDARQERSPPAPAQPPAKPNLLLVVVDTLRADHLGCYGHSRPTSPNLDRLASEGTRFTRSTSPAPWTTPAIGAILTSTWPSSLGIHGLASALPDAALLLPEILREHGYATGAVISHSFCSSKWNFQQGFDSFDESNVLGHDATTSAGVTDRALEFLDAQAKGARPFFLWVHYFDPHFGYVGHPEWEFANKPGYRGPITSGMRFKELVQLRKKLRPADVDQIERFYDSEIAYTDQQIGRLLEGLRTRGLDRDTWIVFTADHGEEFLDHGGLGHTRTLHRELLHVPLILRLQGRLAPGVDERPVTSVDLVPTLLDALGIESPGPLVGRSLLRADAETGGDAALRPIFSETETGRGVRLRSIVMGSLKVVRELDGAGSKVYDLAADPLEKKELSEELARDPELAKKVAAMEQALDAWIAECAAHALEAREVELSENERKRLEEMGYGGENR